MRLSKLLIVAFFSLPITGLAAQVNEEAEDYFKKWLEEDVVYIISEEERDVFLKLATIEERERFIEQFWLRRDPNPRTSINEFREEHFRRIAYANQKFHTGVRGWRTDRGMIYIKFGAPDEIVARPSGGHYRRPFYEGGGSTSAHPFETWRYRHIEGVGSDIEIEFVDPTLSGEYRIATNPWEKDALLTAGSGGATMNEMLGYNLKADRIRNLTNPTYGHDPLGYGRLRLKDQPFEKLFLLTNLERPPKFETTKLQEFVHAEVTYDTLPFGLRNDYLKLEGDAYYALLTLKIPNRELQFDGEKGGIYRATVNVYGEFIDLVGNVERSFEDVIATEIPEHRLEAELQRYSLYQKIIRLRPNRYKLQLVVIDEASDRLGTTVQLVVIPKIDEEDLAISSIIPAIQIEPIEGVGFTEFTIGSTRVFPDPESRLDVGEELPLYFQVYNLTVDQATESPMLDVDYVVSGGGKPVAQSRDEIRDLRGSTINVVKLLPTQDLPAGKYSLEVTITDAINNNRLVRKIPFSVGG